MSPHATKTQDPAVRFDQLDLIPPLLKALQEEGYDQPTPIQSQAIPHVLSGRDLLGCAQTGTGKTAAFALPILQRLYQNPPAPAASGGRPRRAGHRPVRALVLSPTRELAAQIGDSFTAYGRHTGLRHCTVYGGVSQVPQEEALERGSDIVIATPGRLCDLMQQGCIDLKSLEVLVLDEADRMLDMGFLPDVRRIEAQCPEHRQTLFFSATLGPQIMRVSHSFVRDPIRVEVAPANTTVDLIDQRLYYVERGDKIDLLLALLEDRAVERTIVFSRTKHGADKIDRRLHQAGIRTVAIHGNKTQGARQRALDNFKAGLVHVLVATDIAARGIDVENVTHVINFDMPVEPEAYVHRIGRTGRASATGIAISFCTPQEREELRAIEKLIRIQIPLIRAEDILKGRPRSPAMPSRDRHDRSDRGDRGDRGDHRGSRGRRPGRETHDRSDRHGRSDQREPRESRHLHAEAPLPATHDPSESAADREARQQRDIRGRAQGRTREHPADHPPRGRDHGHSRERRPVRGDAHGGTAHEPLPPGDRSEPWDHRDLRDHHDRPAARAPRAPRADHRRDSHDSRDQHGRIEQRTPGPRHAQDSQDRRDNRDSRDGHDNRDSRPARDSHDSHDSRNARGRRDDHPDAAPRHDDRPPSRSRGRGRGRGR